MEKGKDFIRIFITLIIAVCSAISPSIVDAAASQRSITAEDLRTELKDTAEVAHDLMVQKEEEFQVKLDEYLKGLNLKIDELEKRLENLLGDSKKKVKKHLEILKEKNEQVNKEAKKLLKEKKEEFQKKLDETLSEIYQELDNTEKRASELSEEAKVELDSQLNRLHEKNLEIKGQLEALKLKGASSWEDVKNLVFDFLKELVDAYVNILSQFSS